MEQVATRIKRLLEVLSSYSFNLYYIKGKDMILSDALSKQKIDNSKPHEIIPISFNMRNVLYDRYYNIGSMRKTEDKYLAQTRSQSKFSNRKLPEVHGEDKGINLHVQPEKQTLKPIIVSTEVKIPTWKKSRLGQGRAGLRRKVKVMHSQPNKPAQVEPIPLEKQKSEIPTSQTEHIPLTQPLNPKVFAREVLPYPDLKLRPPPRP